MTSSPTDTHFFIAVPADDGAGIYGIGTSEEAAIADAWRHSNAEAPSVSQGDRGEWVVSDWHGIERFDDENDAREYADKRGCRATECTERLYRHIEAHGCDAKSFRWTVDAAGLDDLYYDAA